MKKEIKVVAVVLVALVVFLAGFGLGATKGININVNYEGAAAAPVAGTTAAPTTAAPTTAAPTTAAPTTAAPTTTSVAEGAISDVAGAVSDAVNDVVSDAADAVTDAINAAKTPSTPAEIAAAYNKAINEYRAFTGTVTTKKVETIDIQAKDVPDVVNKVVEKFTGTTENQWTFTNGVDPDGRKPADKIIPGGRDAAVDPAGLVSATATPNTDGGYTMTIKFVSENSDFDGTNTTSNPTYHMGAMDPLNLGTLDISPLKITNAAMVYPGAETTATIDAQGRLVALHNYLPLEGEGSGGLGFGPSITIKIGGAMTTDWTMTYAD